MARKAIAMRASGDTVMGALESEQDLDMGQAQRLHGFYRMSHDVQAARELTYNFVFSNALTLESNTGTAMQLTDRFHAHLQKVWVPFAKAVLDSFRILGLVGVVFRHDDEGNVTPHVPEPGGPCASNGDRTRNSLSGDRVRDTLGSRLRAGVSERVSLSECL